APDGGPRAHASHGDLRHARRRRGDPPRGPCRDDDERAAREGRRRARDRLAVAPQPQGAARASELLPLPARAARLSRGLRRGRRGARSGGGMIARTRRRLVLVGNGMAGMRAIEELLALAPDLYEITVIGAEPHGNYNRILLSPVLAAEKTLDEIMLHRPEWYAERGIELRSGVAAAALERASRRVVLADGERVRYDRLILATGSTPIV